MRLTLALASMALLGIQPSGAWAAEAEPKPCIDLATAKGQATFSGRLTIQRFAGPPNYESIAGGDAEEQAFILELPERLCATDGAFIGPSTPFDRVHVSASDDVMLRVLQAAVGNTVTVRGEALGAHTGHHHAPVVLMAGQVTVVRKVR